VIHPREILENSLKGAIQEPFLEEPSYKEPFSGEGSQGNLPDRNLSGHIERESIYTTLSLQEPFSEEGSVQKGSVPEGSLSSRVPSALSFVRTYPPTLTDSVIDRFYSMTGQPRISRQKRERSRAQLFDLLRQGFRLDDVICAIDWAREHITTPIHSFGIIPEIIGQALGKRDANRRDTLRPPSTTTSRSRDDQQEHEAAQLAEIQASLSTEELAALQQEAAELVDQEYG